MSDATPTQAQGAPSSAARPSDWRVQAGWALALGGVGLFALGGWMTFEALNLFAGTLNGWLACIGTDGGAMVACSEMLEAPAAWRLGWNAGAVLGVGLALLFVSPVPLIVMLNRYRQNWIAALLFVVVVFPYGLLAFLLLVIATLAVLFYGSEVFA